MEIELYSVIAAVILIATLTTAFFTLVAYAVFQIRKRGKVTPPPAPSASTPQFIRRYQVG